MRSRNAFRCGPPAPLAAALALCAAPVFAQAPEAEPTPSPSPPVYRHAESVVVQAIRADAETPVTKTDLDRGEIERLDRGQEMPLLLQQAPSMTGYSDGGLGAGYSYFYIRGIQQTRVNMNLDGAPLNEPEDSALYFADFGGFAGALSSIQIQRGVGASTVGTASFGGSINFESVDPGDHASLSALMGLGTFDSRRGSLDLHSGQLPGRLALYGRVAYQDTEGFREHSGVRQRTVFYGASRPGERSLFKLSGFSGDERSQLAFLASEAGVLERDPRDNPLDPAERDHFGQDFVQAQYTRFVGASSSVAVQGYYDGAGGWYRLWEDPAHAALLQYGLDWRLVGGLLSFDHARDRWSLTWSVHANDFESRHAQDVVDGPHTYDNRGFKSEANSFAKLGYRAGRFQLYGDAQIRHASFRYEGSVPQGSVGWTFFNPKLGARFRASAALAFYASAGRALREPARMDMLSGEDDATVVHDLHAVKPERLADFETGAEYSGRDLRAQLVAYAMEFHDEIALSGELSEIGLPLRRNVDRSYRRGLELDLGARLGPKLGLRASANVNHSRIRAWTQFYDVYDEDGGYLETVSRVHSDVRPLLTPALTANLELTWTPSADASLAVSGRYVSASNLDNTGSDSLRAPAFGVLDASVRVGLGRWLPKGRPRLRLDVTNLLDAGDIRPSGYSYPFFVRDAQGHDSPSGISYYYPLASRSVFLGLELGV